MVPVSVPVPVPVPVCQMAILAEASGYSRIPYQVLGVPSCCESRLSTGNEVGKMSATFQSVRGQSKAGYMGELFAPVGLPTLPTRPPKGRP